MGHYECKKCNHRFDECTCPPKTYPNPSGKSFLERHTVTKITYPGRVYDPRIGGERVYVKEGPRLQVTIPQKCSEHPRYQVLRKPRVPCEACWRLWIKANP